jgi:hypothetical protein
LPISPCHFFADYFIYITFFADIISLICYDFLSRQIRFATPFRRQPMPPRRHEMPLADYFEPPRRFR